jgi:YbbR domain-containing protein
MNILQWIRENLSSLVLSILLALVIWVSAVTSANPNVEADLVVPLVVKGMASDITIIDQVPENVNLTVLAPESVIEAVQQENVITTQIDLSDLDAGTYRFPILVNLPEEIRPIRVIEQTPTQLQLSLGKIISIEKNIKINVEGEPAVGYKVGSLEWDQSPVTISGREDLIQQVDSVIGTLDISDASENVTRELPLVAQDEMGNPITNITLSPETVRVNQVIDLQGGYRNVAVNVVTQGLVEPGYRFTSITPAPPTVMVFSENPQLVEQLPGYINTNPLDLTGIDGYLETILELDLPDGVTVVGDPTVLVQVNVTALETNISVSREIEVIGLLPGLTAEVSPPQVSVRVSGPVPVLDNLTERDIRVIVDLTNFDAGVHTVEPTVEILPTDVELEDISPVEVEVRIEAESSTATGS